MRKAATMLLGILAVLLSVRSIYNSAGTSHTINVIYKDMFSRSSSAAAGTEIDGVPADADDTDIKDVIAEDSNTERPAAIEDAPPIMIQQNVSLKEFTQPSLDPAKKRRIFFVHLGKAGGSTVRQALKSACIYKPIGGGRNKCFEDFRENKNETRLSMQTFGFTHCEYVTPWNPWKGQKNVTTFLWNVRNPIDRTASWFDHAIPGNAPPKKGVHAKRSKGGWAHDFFRLCHKDVDAFARSLAKQKTLDQVPVSSTTGESCSQLSWRGVNGKAYSEGSHLHYNYRFYANRTTARFPGKEVMVVRTEHMWDDLQNIEHMVGGGVLNKEEYLTVDHGSSSFRTRSKLSPEGAKTLCCALQNEIAIYVDLLMKASNLNGKSRNESLSDLWNKCDMKSFEEMETTCRTILPE
jgi:hypothetical protein